jgi:3-oxoacyl-[acyl-carrier protein] reductase
MKLKGRVAIVTGGARGMGRAICLALARQGVDIVTCDRGKDLPFAVPLASKDELEDTVVEIKRTGCRAFGLIADVSKTEEVKEVVDSALKEFGKVDILVNNAGLGGIVKPCQEVTEEEWEMVQNVNLRGPWLFCKYVIPHMLKQGNGRIINISSVGGLVAMPAPVAPYICSKHGLIGLTRALAWELAPYKVTVNAICPGAVDTPMLRKTAERMGMEMDEGLKAWTEPMLFKELIPPRVCGGSCCMACL